MGQAGFHVDAETFRRLEAQGVHGRKRRTAIEPYARQWKPGRVELGGLCEHATPELFDAQVQNLRRIEAQIEGQKLVSVLGVEGDRRDEGCAAAIRGIGDGTVYQGLAIDEVDQVTQGLPASMRKVPTKQLGLPCLDEAGQADGGMDVMQRVMGSLVADAVRLGQGREGEDGPAALFGGPHYALGPEVVGCAHEVYDVPAAVAVLPLALVGIEEVAVQETPHELVVELQRVEAR